MAAGDIIFFDQWLVDVQEAIHNHESDSFRLGLITSAATPAATDADPRWGAGGGTNFATNEVTPGGNYSAGGPTLANPSVTLVGGLARWDADDVSIAQNGSNPTNARWGIIYNDTATGKQAVGFLDLGADINLSSGNFSVTWNANGISEMNQA